jgi:hypothetical protein
MEKVTPSGGHYVMRYGGTPLVGTWSKTRHRYTIYWWKKKKHYKVARLVCEAFHGPPPFPRAVAMHTDENSRNNFPSNLKWGTQKENLNAPGFVAYCKSRIGASNPHAKGIAARQAALVTP